MCFALHSVASLAACVSSETAATFLERFAWTVSNSKFALDANAGHSSVGRASDCKTLQPSDGPWFDSGWGHLHKSKKEKKERSVSFSTLETERMRKPGIDTGSQVWEACMMLAHCMR